MAVTEKKFNLRAFVALMIAIAVLGLPVTGLANHLYGLSPLSVARHAWMAAHNVLGLLFAVFAVWHVVLNRRALGAYLKSVTARVPVMSREALVALALVAFVMLLSVGHAFHAGA